MLHARRTARGRLAAPALLVTAILAALGGLAVIPATAQTEDRAVVAAADAVPLLADIELNRERDVARASRDRQLAAEAAARAAAEAAAAEAAAKAAAEAQAKAEAEAKAAAEAKAKAEREAARKRSGSIPASGGFACPVPNASFTDTYGASRSGGRSHQGTDLLAPYGSPVYAVTSGVVRTASSSLGGISLYLRGDNGETYFYAHNSANVASTGQRVAAGDLIARVGSTGNAGGTNHVHFERQVGGTSVNPYPFLSRIC